VTGLLNAVSYPAMSIFLIRHGETEGNAARIVQRPDIPLSPRGQAQAERLARRLADAGITGIFSGGRSPTVRQGGLNSSIPDMSVDLSAAPYLDQFAQPNINIHSQTIKQVDLDYDGTPYYPDWPNSVLPDRFPSTFLQFQPFTRFGQRYPQIQFVTDNSATQFVTGCDPQSGQNCVLPAPGPGNFYPYWTQARVGGACVWEFGNMRNGNTFGGVTQYGTVNSGTLGAFASAMVVADILRLLHGGESYSVISTDLRNPSSIKAVPNAQPGEWPNPAHIKQGESEIVAGHYTVILTARLKLTS